MPFATPSPAPGPDWSSITTAIGTVAVAVVAVAVALFAEWRADKRMAAERAHSAVQLAEERKRAAAQIAEERRLFGEREQLAEAYLVQIALGQETVEELPDDYADPGGGPVERLIALAINHGKFTITRVEARFSTDGGNLIAPRRQARMPARLPRAIEHKYGFPELAEKGTSSGDRLTPWDTAMAFTALIGAQRVTDLRVIVRWTDRWGTRWEHKSGEVWQIEESDPWQP